MLLVKQFEFTIMLSQQHKILNKFRHCKYISTFCRHKSTRVENTVFLEKTTEGPVITLHTDEVDLIGPPDPVSNLRPIIRRRLVSETKLQEQLRQMQDATHHWNQQFWSNHNTRFIEDRQKFIESHQIPGKEKRQLTVEEMSEFYKKFLDENWRIHLDYNFKWYKKNFTLLFMSLKVSIEKNLARIV
ncbi:hypothetical protein HHI36_008877 [Cryptolaemus montrouzieri]|uniref:Uncharacterized protein n=1 Tax=Cryptolaemus montrouzieri TaxID=559131 RepID=A0ABD2MTT2_9CUCU